jgi:hypothetical protein
VTGWKPLLGWAELLAFLLLVRELYLIWQDWRNHR